MSHESVGREVAVVQIHRSGFPGSWFLDVGLFALWWFLVLFDSPDSRRLQKNDWGRFGFASSEEMGWVASQNESWEGGTFIRWLCLYYPEGYMATCGYGSPCSSYDFKWMVVKSEMQPKFQDLEPKISHQWEGPTKACRGGCCLMLLMIKFD